MASKKAKTSKAPVEAPPSVTMDEAAMLTPKKPKVMEGIDFWMNKAMNPQTQESLNYWQLFAKAPSETQQKIVGEIMELISLGEKIKTSRAGQHYFRVNSDMQIQLLINKLQGRGEKVKLPVVKRDEFIRDYMPPMLQVDNMDTHLKIHGSTHLVDHLLEAMPIEATIVEGTIDARSHFILEMPESQFQIEAFTAEKTRLVKEVADFWGFTFQTGPAGPSNNDNNDGNE